jgi:hypothetical protein
MSGEYAQTDPNAQFSEAPPEASTLEPVPESVRLEQWLANFNTQAAPGARMDVVRGVGGVTLAVASLPEATGGNMWAAFVGMGFAVYALRRTQNRLMTRSAVSEQIEAARERETLQTILPEVGTAKDVKIGFKGISYKNDQLARTIETDEQNGIEDPVHRNTAFALRRLVRDYRTGVALGSSNWHGLAWVAHELLADHSTAQGTSSTAEHASKQLGYKLAALDTHLTLARQADDSEPSWRNYLAQLAANETAQTTLRTVLQRYTE